LASTIVLGGGDDVSNAFAKKLALHLGLDYVEAKRKIFPDGESYLRIEEASVYLGKVVLVKSMTPPQDKSIVETLLLLDLLREKGAEEIILVAPYLAYARQDREFLPGEVVSIRSILRSLKNAGADTLVTVEIHKEESLKFFNGKAINVSPFSYMASKVAIEGSLVVLAPDLGALRRAREFAEAVGAEFDYLVKRRDRITGDITLEPKNVKVKGRNVVIVDDIISTGGTVAKAAELLLSQGAESITVVVAHALMAGDAASKLKKAGVSAVYAANTLPLREPGLVQHIDITPLVADRLSEVL
jgi:ribose-phosphate pyrophosphokinase